MRQRPGRAGAGRGQESKSAAELRGLSTKKPYRASRKAAALAGVLPRARRPLRGCARAFEHPLALLRGPPQVGGAGRLRRPATRALRRPTHGHTARPGPLLRLAPACSAAARLPHVSRRALGVVGVGCRAMRRAPPGSRAPSPHPLTARFALAACPGRQHLPSFPAAPAVALRPALSPGCCGSVSCTPCHRDCAPRRWTRRCAASRAGICSS